MILAFYGHNRERGQSLVEFGLLLPVLMIVLLAFFDFGRAIYAHSVVAHCAREGARFGITDPENPDDIVTLVESTAVGLDLAQLTVNVTYPGDDQVQVEVSYVFQLVTPLIAQVVSESGSLTLRSATTMYMGY